MRHLQLGHDDKIHQQKQWIMKRKPPRSKVQIYGDLLRILEEEAFSKKIILTQIQRRIDVPFDRLKKYVTDLSMLALIENEKTLRVTKKGKQYIHEYGNIIQSMEKMSQVITACAPDAPEKA